MLRDPRLRLALSVALLVLLVDQITKAIVAQAMTLYQTIPIVPGFSLTYVRNTGAAFGLLGSAPRLLRLPLFLLVTGAALLTLAGYLRSTPPERRWLIAALGAILGGAVGNLVCRLRFGEVIDFFHLYRGGFDWPMFNVADSAISVGVAIVLLESIRGSSGARSSSAPEARTTKAG